MTFNELLAEVYILTNRPDLVAETKSAIRAATLKMHQTDFYSKDIYETYITLGTAAYVHSIDYISLINNLRSFKYVRKIDSSGEAAAFIEILSPEELFDSYRQAKVDVAYVAGRVLEIKSSTEVDKLLLACYIRPVVTDSGFSSWVAEQYPYAIVYEAARVVFKTIGYDEQSRSYGLLTGEQINLLRASALSDIGY